MNRNENSSIIRKCKDCSAEFSITAGEAAFFKSHKLCLPKRCKACRDARELGKARNMQKLNPNEQAPASFNEVVAAQSFILTTINDIEFSDPSKVLCVIGNGFDLAHGARSSYWDFHNSMGKRNILKETLETWIKVDYLWSDFERALAHVNLEGMLSSVDMWLDLYDAFDPDAQAAAFCAACDETVGPLYTIQEKLPKAFRRWVDSIEIDNTNKPLERLIRPEFKYLNFNYTEFLTSVYGVPEDQITYLHGCRTNKEKLVLGHAVGEQYKCDIKLSAPRYRSRRKRKIVEDAIETASRYADWYYDVMSKNTAEVIEEHAAFFDGLAEVHEVIVVGHSLADVDLPYYKRMVDSFSSPKSVRWIFSCHSVGSIGTIADFCDEMGVDCSAASVFKL